MGAFQATVVPAAWIAADVVRFEDGKLAEHWDVLQDEATQAESVSGLPMFGDHFPASTVTSRTIVVEHIKIESGKRFEEVRRALEETIPKLNPAVGEFLRKGDQERATAEEEHGPKLSIFLDRDHGALLQIAGGARNARQYEIGNPLTASKMTRHQLAAALYAPLRVVLYEGGNGGGIFEYDKPSSLFGQFGDERVTEVGRYLDETLEAALLRAAS